MSSTGLINETFYQFQLRIARNLRKKDVEELKFLFQDHIDADLESIKSGLDLMGLLRRNSLISKQNLSKLKKNLKLCGRTDLANKVDPFLTNRADRLKRYNNLRGKFIALKSNNNKYVTSTEGGEINASATDIGPKEKFEVVFSKEDFKIALKSYPNQKYLAVEIDSANDNTVSANQDNQGDEAEFTIEFFDTDKVALKSCHDKYIVAEGDLIDANHKDITQRETFTLEFVEIDTPLNDRGPSQDTDSSFPIVYCFPTQIGKDLTDVAGVTEQMGSVALTQTTDTFECYPIKSNPCGRCVIFNNKFQGGVTIPGDSDGVFIKLGQRNGSDSDANRLEILFNWLLFDVEVCTSYSADEMKEKLKVEAENTDNDNRDCFVTFILSHGKKGAVYGNDGNIITIKEIKDMFKGHQCRNLLGKPKLFFIQACQGRADDTAVAMDPDRDSAGLKNCERAVEMDQGERYINTHADMLLFMATTEDTTSFRHPVEGTWFIQYLCTVFEKHAGTWRLCDLMLTVNKNISQKHVKLYELGNEVICTQMSNAMSTLTKGLKFKTQSKSFNEYKKHYTPKKQAEEM